MDTTIPAHRLGRPAQITWGRFVNYGDRVLLVDRHGNTYATEYVTIIPSFWGYDEDGCVKMPRPWTYTPGTENPIVKGDVVLILFMDNNPQRPIVIGSARSFADNDFGIPYDHESDGDINGNVLRFRLRHLDPTTGASSGQVRATVNDVAPGVAEIDRGKAVATEYVMRGESLVADLLAAVPEMIAACTALGLPTVNLTTLLTNLTTSSTAKAPYVSSSLKVE